jgi:uncharacterized BrkB/YihY/UPF0761 family membrane protein
MRINYLVVIIGFLFSPLAALAAFLITYEEYLHHKDKRLALKFALQAAVLTLIVFIILSIGISFYITKIITE